MKMPEPDAAVMARQAQIAAALVAIVPDGVIADAAGVSPYGSDGLVMYRQNPLAVVLPRTTEQVSKVLAWCHANGVKVVARGSGTSLSGGALPLADAVLLGMGSKLELWSEQAHLAQIRHTIIEDDISDAMLDLRI